MLTCKEGLQQKDFCNDTNFWKVSFNVVTLFMLVGCSGSCSFLFTFMNNIIGPSESETEFKAYICKKILFKS